MESALVGDGSNGTGFGMALEVFLDLHSKQPGLRRLLQFGLSYCEVDIIIIFAWVEDGEQGFPSVRNKVVGVEVFDETVEFGLRKLH